MRKENDIVLINRECQKILCSYKQDDLDTVDGILDEIKKTKNYLMSLIKQTTANEDVKRIGKELFKLIFQIIKDSIENKLNFENEITNLTDVILS